MKTILVIYSDTLVTNDKRLKGLKQYAFNTSDNIQVNDCLRSDRYKTAMQVVKVLDESFQYYNAQTGELSNKITSTLQFKISNLVLGTNDEDTIYAHKL